MGRGLRSVRRADDANANVTDDLDALHPCPERVTPEQLERWAVVLRDEEQSNTAPGTPAYQRLYGHDGMGGPPDDLAREDREPQDRSPTELVGGDDAENDDRE